MSSVVPFVRHMLLCEDVRPNPARPRKINIYNLITEVGPTASGTGYPLRLTFSVYLALTGGRGAGEGQVRVTNADTGLTIYVGRRHPIRFAPDPLAVKGVHIRVTICSFPEPGLYAVEFWYNGAAIAQQPLLAR
jgi:hypothetical protein